MNFAKENEGELKQFLHKDKCSPEVPQHYVSMDWVRPDGLMHRNFKQTTNDSFQRCFDGSPFHERIESHWGKEFDNVEIGRAHV